MADKNREFVEGKVVELQSGNKTINELTNWNIQER